MPRLTTGEDIETARDLARMAGYRDPNEYRGAPPDKGYGDTWTRAAVWKFFLEDAKKINDDYMLTIANVWS